MSTLRERLQEQAGGTSVDGRGETPGLSHEEITLCNEAIQKLATSARGAEAAELLLPPSESIVVIL